MFPVDTWPLTVTASCADSDAGPRVMSIMSCATIETRWSQMRTRVISLEGVATVRESGAFGVWGVDSVTCSPRYGLTPRTMYRGEIRKAALSSPSSPKRFSPQQTTALSANNRPQVWVSPALIAANLNPPATFVGAARVVVVLSPTCPPLLPPQQ